VGRRINLPELRCTVCGAAGEGGWRCRCGGPLDLPEAVVTGVDRLSGAGLRRYAPFVPLPAEMLERVSLGEGGTALVAAGDLPGVWLKLEFVSPTGSFKDRGAAVLVASALTRGAAALVADSSGNAGSAIAAYAARAGLACTVFVPSGTSPAKQGQIRAYGADLRVVGGDRSAAAEAAIAAVSPETGSTYASHVYDPMFLQGTKTFAYECWEQLGRAPDAVVVPVGNGTLALGAFRGFRELLAGGLVDRMPRLIAVQSERCAPLAAAWASGEAVPAKVPPAPATVAEGIAIRTPARGAQVLAAVRSTRGCVLSVPEAAIAPAQADLGRRGLLVEPTAAVAWAAALLLSRHPAMAAVAVDRSGWRDAGVSGTMVVPLCGSGLKTA
jgi:threonine synthase